MNELKLKMNFVSEICFKSFYELLFLLNTGLTVGEIFFRNIYTNYFCIFF